MASESVRIPSTAIAVMRRFLGLFAAVAVAGVPARAIAQAPAGPEFRINTFTASKQVSSSVGMDAVGNFVVVWESRFQDGSGFGIFGQRFDAAGNPRGTEFRINTFTSGEQRNPSVAVEPIGKFIVIWAGAGQDGSLYSIFGQRFDSLGLPQGSEFRVNSSTTVVPRYPSLAGDPQGNFVVVWATSADGSGDGVVGRAFESNSLPRGPEFQVNTYTTGNQRHPSVVLDSAGNFVVVWQSQNIDGSFHGIFGQRYDAAGAPRGLEFRVGDVTLQAELLPSVTTGPDGGFLVVWDSQDGNSLGVVARRFGADGTPLGPRFPVNTFTTSEQRGGSAAIDGSGRFLINWSSFGQDGSLFGVYGQRYRADGLPNGAEFRVNSYTTNVQSAFGVAADNAGNFVAIWMSDGQDGNLTGVYGQRFGGLHPAALSVDGIPSSQSDGNRVFEPGETVIVIPTWRNATDGFLSFSGVLAPFVGPGDPSQYLLVDRDADYLVPAGQTGSCSNWSNCYALAVGVPTIRPALHWDGLARESLTFGHTWTHVVHIGDSFSDVHRSSPFYRFIETLLHKAVAGGCGANVFCPSAATTREQIAVFALRSKDGPSFSPPGCSPPNLFSDVPETSPFCPAIEEIARRGVVAGCGEGNYCPTAPVTREQMAVFMLKTLDPTLNPPACVGPNVFEDVPETSPFCPWIEELARRGVVAGCAPQLYCPAEPVPREQTAVFVAKTFGLTLYGP